jgi:hypothetical protein
VRSGRNHRAGCVQINGGINIVATHPQHQGPQMLHGAIAINKQDTGFVSGWSHGTTFWFGRLLSEYTRVNSCLWPYLRSTDEFIFEQ